MNRETWEKKNEEICQIGLTSHEKIEKNINNIHIFGKEIIDDNCIVQLANCFGDDDLAVLTADSHKGYSMPIGGCIAYKNHISPSGVGFDIGCGNKAVRTNVQASEIDISKVMDEIFRRISFGMGRPNNEKVDHDVIDQISNSSFPGQRALARLAADQLGTVGSGNHFVDLFTDDDGWLWIGVHFGSRGFGHKTASGFFALSQGLSFTDHRSQGSMDSHPTLFKLDSYLGLEYTNAMSLAGSYAYAGRDVVVNKVLEILDNPKVTLEVHNHHNFAWSEEHFGETWCVVRKGCTPAFPGQLGFIGANMMDMSVIIEGVDSEESRKGLYSTVHGAGRVMSRTQAAGKKKWIRGEDGKKRPEIISPGCVDWNSVKETMKTYHVELRGAGADEAPQCYKNLEEVLKYQGDTVKVVHRLFPIGVAMAGNEYDPYVD